MFKARLQAFIAGVLVTVLIVGTLALATPQIREISYGVNVVINGELQEFDDDMQPFIMDGRTFLPVRGIAEALGVHVHWDTVRNTAHLVQPGEAPTDHTIIGEWRMVGWRWLDEEIVCLDEFFPLAAAYYYWPGMPAHQYQFEYDVNKFVEFFVASQQQHLIFSTDGNGNFTLGGHFDGTFNWSVSYGFLIREYANFTQLSHYNISENQLTIRRDYESWIYERIKY